MRLTDNPADTPIDMSGDVIYAPYALLSNDDYVPPNGESYNMFVARVRDALLDIVKNSDGNTIAIATHTGVAKNIIKQFTDVKWPRGGMPNAEYLKLEYDGEKFTLIDMPDWLSPVLLGTESPGLFICPPKRAMAFPPSVFAYYFTPFPQRTQVPLCVDRSWIWRYNRNILIAKGFSYETLISRRQNPSWFYHFSTNQ